MINRGKNLNPPYLPKYCITINIYPFVKINILGFVYFNPPQTQQSKTQIKNSLKLRYL